MDWKASGLAAFQSIAENARAREQTPRARALMQAPANAHKSCSERDLIKQISHSWHRPPPKKNLH